MTREEFIRRSMRSEARFIGASLDDPGTQIVSIGNWRCECGHEERSAAKMWDHAQTHARPGQQEMFHG